LQRSGIVSDPPSAIYRPFLAHLPAKDDFFVAKLHNFVLN